MATKPFPMFPLQSVLFPNAPLPLHVFEPRYRALADDCLSGDGRFGVVLIERGREVGGGDSRFSVGTVARIVEAARTPDGRYLLATLGHERLRVKKWLPDGPYPRAEIDIVSEPKRFDARAHDQRVVVSDLLARVLDLWSQLDPRAPGRDAAELDPDPLRASFEAAARSPIGPLDAQRLLELDDPCERFDELEAMLTEEAEVMQFRLAGG
jgi:Lon protease-like protein